MAAASPTSFDHPPPQVPFTDHVATTAQSPAAAAPARPAYYQIEYQADATGKHIPSTKRRILFHFGTLDPQTNRPTDDGMHIVTLSWSPTSGRTILAADGREVTLRDGNRMLPRVQNKFEESWVLGEEGGVTSSNDLGVHLRIVARRLPARTKKIKRGDGGRRQHHAGERQFDLFIDGRSYFDLPMVDASGRLVSAPPSPAVDTHSISSKDNDWEAIENSDSEGADHDKDINTSTIEEWNTDSSAIVGDDGDSIDGFMENIDLGKSADDEVEGQDSSSKRRVGRGGSRGMGKKGRERIITAKKKLAAGTSKVLSSPIALMRRGGDGDGSNSSEQVEEGQTIGDDNSSSSSKDKEVEEGHGGDGDGSNSSEQVEEGQTIGDNNSSSSSKDKEAGEGQRIAPGDYPSFYSMHQTIMQQNEMLPQQNQEQPQQQKEGDQEKEDTAEEVIARLKDQISLAKEGAERLKASVKMAEEKSKSLQNEKEFTEEEIHRLKERISTLEEALVSARANNNRARKKGAPFVPNEEVASYLGDPKCCLCYKDVTENMRDCQCGKESCDLSAHASCLIGTDYHPTPSVSHPGTPAPALPLILCRGNFDNEGLKTPRYRACKSV